MQATSGERSLGIVVPHTHWDRAWYLPFQAYRLRLVEMMDDLIGWLEAGRLPLFVLDGQTVLLDDVFSVRPDLRPRVQALVEAGRLKVGPWFTMPDLFLARPESLIRNLQRGLRSADALGGGSRVGYVPDSFGHFAQLPQLLRGFQIDSFLFMRGMPEALRDTEGAVFHWQAPDGSQVLATYLREGYFPLGALGQESFHGRYDGLPAQPELAHKRLTDTLARLNPVHKNAVKVLPAGGDHLPARADLQHVIDELNRTQSDITLKFGSFEDYLAQLRSEAYSFAAWRGDLLGQADHPLLRNVLSSRVDLKILNHQAQSVLCGVVEPLMAWSSLQGLPLVHKSLIETAWDALLKNHAHDDICGCSVDPVHLDNVQRYEEILALAQEVIHRQLEHAVQHVWGPAAHSRAGRLVVINPHPWAVRTRVQSTLLFPDDGGEFSAQSPARALQAQDAQGRSVDIEVLSTRCKDLRSRYLETTWGRSYDVALNVAVPPLGVAVFSIAETSAPLGVSSAAAKPIPQELLTAFEFQLDADLGDGYSFGPCPEIPTQTSRLVSAHRDPVDAQLVHLEYEIEGHRFVQRDALLHKPLNACLGPRITMKINVLACEILQPQAGQNQGSMPCWSLAVSYTNECADTRLRVVFPVPQSAQTVVADSQALWQERRFEPGDASLWPGLLAEPRYPGEKPYPVHHTNDGVVCCAEGSTHFFGGVGLHEFEMLATARGKALALTLHRAVGSLSVRGGRIRSCQAGPQRPTPDAQMLRALNHRVILGQSSTCDTASALRILKQELQPVWVQEIPVVPSARASTAGCAESLCDVGESPLQLMSCRVAPEGDGILLRLLNPTAENLSLSVRLHPQFNRACAYELDDRTPQQSTSHTLSKGVLPVEFKPYQIKTWKLSC